MRITRVALTVALMLVPAVSAAQQTASTPSTPTTTGKVDFGVRGTDLSGDSARFERYRDLGDGLFLDVFRLNRQQNDWLFDFWADHLGRKDQRFIARAAQPGKVKAWFKWDQIPMLMSRSTRSLFQGDLTDPTGVLTIDDAIQQQVQASANNLPGLFALNAQAFDTRTRRHVAEAAVEVLPTADFSVKALFRSTTREGLIPYGGSFGHSQVVETLAPTNHSLKDFDGGVEYARGDVLVRGGYTGSWFTNDITSVTFDNPWRLTDASNASSRGRYALPPTNSYMGVNGLISVKLPQRSRLSAYVSAGSLKDDGAPILPYTVNAAAPAAQPFPRETVDGEAGTKAINLSFSSRPTSQWDVSLRYRGYDYDNRTPEFSVSQRSSYDNGLSTLAAPITTEPFNIVRKTFDADVRFLPMTGTSVGIGFSRFGEDRHHRIFESTTDNVFRLSFDSIGNQWFTLRTKYERAQKRGHGFDEEVLTSVSEQAGMRHFDIAARDRNRITVLGMVMPTSTIALNASIAAGNDDYLQSLFGLRDNNHRVYGVGIDATPNDRVVLAMSYSFENYMSLQRSRQANPGAEVNDERRNWAADGDDKVHSFILSADFMQVVEKLDLRLALDVNRSRSLYSYITGAVPDRTLPEETVDVISTLPTPTQLPAVKSNFSRASFDGIYSLSERLGLGLSYWYERFDVDDFALDAESTPNLARTNAVLLGYLYRPYTANTFWGRLIVKF